MLDILYRPATSPTAPQVLKQTESRAREGASLLLKGRETAPHPSLPPPPPHPCSRFTPRKCCWTGARSPLFLPAPESLRALGPDLPAPGGLKEGSGATAQRAPSRALGRRSQPSPRPPRVQSLQWQGWGLNGVTGDSDTEPIQARAQGSRPISVPQAPDNRVPCHGPRQLAGPDQGVPRGSTQTCGAHPALPLAWWL